MSIKITPVPTTFSVAFLGLGAMGYPMAGHLARAGHTVTVYNRTESKALQWVEQYGGEYKVKRAAMPVDAAWKAKIVFACVSSDEALRAIALGKNGAFAGMKPGTVFVNHSTTTSANVDKELAEIATGRAIGYMIAPIMEGDAEKGTLKIIAGGELPVYERVKPIASCYSPEFLRVGAGFLEGMK
ncbi:MAG: NAD(P)-dependent oxidoreductase [Saezia sp.]